MTTCHTFELAVVGGGIAGFTAALRAAEGGLSVVLLEKLEDERHVCNSRLTGGIFHVALEGLFDEPATIAARIRRVVDDTADPALVDAVAKDALRLVRWLQGQGMRFMRSGREPWQTFTLAPPSLPQFGRRWQGRSGDVLLRLLETRLVAAGGTVLRGHRANRLSMEAGRCVGVAGVTADAISFEVRSRCVVIADGGFQADPELLRRHTTPDPSRLFQRNARTGIGDGLKMAEAAGAALTDLSPFYGHLLSRDALRNDRLWPFPWADDLARSSMVVGPDGRRFADEGLGGVYLANQVARLADPASAVVVFDDDTWQGPGTLRAMSANPYLVEAGGTLHTAPSLEALAERAALPVGALVAEVDAYNRALESDALELLRPARTTPKSAAWAIRRPPFHALPIVAGITYTMGGIRIDAHARVVATGGGPIAGLYAAGAATGGLEGGPRLGYVGGLVKSGVTGLRAGEHAVATLRSEASRQ